jgi:hypothetical protein
MDEKGSVELYRKIKAQMVLCGITGAAIARKLGVTTGHVSQVIARKRGSRRVVDALVTAGLPRELFNESK